MNSHNKEHRRKLTLVPCLLLALATSVVGTVMALPPGESGGITSDASVVTPTPTPLPFPPQGTREIVSDDFTKNRPEAKPTVSPKGSQGQSPSGATAGQKRRRYRLASQPMK